MSAPTNPSPRLGHLPGLDGLRGVAIAAVLIFHLEWAWLPGGFFGVDVFFVLSGFLITTLLLEEHFQSGLISLRSFFFRRMIRLYPALLGLVAFSTLYTLVLHRETGLSRAASIASSVLFYYANWMTLADTNAWFGGMPHTWSLAIEAQFYVLWALIITGLTRRYSSPEKRSLLLKILTGIALGIVVASSAWRALLWAEGATWLRPYLGTDTRLDGVFIGAIVALSRLQCPSPTLTPESAKSKQWVFTLLGTAAIAIIATLFHTVPFGSALPGHIGFSLVNLAAAGLIFSILQHPDSLWSNMLSWHPLVWLGKISYSMYIWHVIVVKLLKTERLTGAGLPLWAAESMRLVASFLIAAASYYLIERKFIRWKHRNRSPDLNPLQSSLGH